MSEIIVPQPGEIWQQYAHVITPDWKKLKPEDEMEVLLSDTSGKWRKKTTKMSKEYFLEYYFATQYGIFIHTIKITERQKDSNSVLIVFLNDEGKELRADRGEHSEKSLAGSIVIKNFFRISGA